MNIKHFKMKNKKKWIAGGCIAGVLALSAVGWNVLARNQDTGAMMPADSVQVTKSDISKSIQGTGVLTPENSVDVKVPTGVKITEMKVKAGDNVKTGDVLAVTEGNTVTAELMAAKEKLAETEKKFKKADSKKAEYYNLAKSKQNLEEKINILNKIEQTSSIVASADGTVTTVNGQAGEVNKTSPKENSGNNQSQNNSSEGKNGASQQNQSMHMELSDVVLARMNEGEENSTQLAPPVQIEFPNLKLGAPVTGQPQTKEIEETESYTGRVEWNKPADVFAGKTVYAARVTLTAKPGFCFVKGAEPKIEGAAISDVMYKGEDTVQSIAFTAMYPETEPENKEDGKEPPKDEGSQDPLGGDKDNQNPSDSADKKDEAEKEKEQPSESQEGADDGGFSGGWPGGGAPFASSGGGEAAPGSGDGKEVNTELVSVFTISSGDKMKVGIQVDEMDILSVSMGQKANITLNALPGQVFEGEITHINKVGQANNGVTKYSVEITAKKNDKMLSGMNVSASVLVEEKKDVLTVPAAAISEEGGKSYVYTATDEKTGELSGRKEVATGLTDGVNIEIANGVKEGSLIYYQATEPAAGDSDPNADAGDPMMM